MMVTKTALMRGAAASLLLLVAGCTSERFSGSSQIYQRPAPIRAAPMGQVSQSQLPPPDGSYDMSRSSVEDTQMAALETPGNALELSAASIAGVWQAAVDGMPCQIATPMTKFGQGYRAGPMRCPVALSNVNAWNVQGQELILYNRDGEAQATLYSTNGTSFVGRSQDGAQIILTR